MDTFRMIIDSVSLISNLFTIVASAIAIVVFFAKRKELSTALSLLLNWSYQTTLSDIVGKLDRLSEYNANEPTDIPEIKNILHEIAGQIRGNTRLLSAAPTMPERVEAFASGKRLAEPSKRSMVAEIREVVRNLQVRNMNSESGA
ncbi:MAG: hypothetical protein HYR72_20355 [Deltaproteobacteria bacterium]|nr:hypothetical protein [Deltaproteobacteria bacterium]MBI3389394.1 hypothetical protein [Deltaproteobacteria bacterium]